MTHTSSRLISVWPTSLFLEKLLISVVILGITNLHPAASMSGSSGISREISLISP